MVCHVIVENLVILCGITNAELIQCTCACVIVIPTFIFGIIPIVLHLKQSIPGQVSARVLIEKPNESTSNHMVGGI